MSRSAFSAKPVFHTPLPFMTNLLRAARSGLLIACAAMTSPALAQSPQHARAVTVSHQVPYQLRYLVFYPKTYSRSGPPVPLILFLHGAGEMGTDLDKLKTWGPPAIVEKTPDFPFMVVSPQLTLGQSWDFEGLKTLLDEVLKNDNVDRRRIYLTGMSFGGFGTWEMAMRYPDYFAAIAPICGAAHPGEIARIKDIPTWVFHGKEDTSVPEQASSMLVEVLKAAGGHVQYTVLPETGHVGAWVHAYDPKNGLFDWLLRQRKP